MTAGTSNGGEIVRSVSLASGGAIILYEPADLFTDKSGRARENLIRVDDTGTPVWVAKPPGSPDYFVDFALNDDELLAWAFSGYKLVIDLETGRTLSQTFTK